MMMECPKCGFQQPEDQFCAQCGIDVQAYKKRPIPKVKKLWNKLSVQISLTLVLITVLLTVFYIKNNQVIPADQSLSAIWDKDISQTSSKQTVDAQSVESSLENNNETEEDSINYDASNFQNTNTNDNNAFDSDSDSSEASPNNQDTSGVNMGQELLGMNSEQYKLSVAAVEAPISFIRRLGSIVTPLNKAGSIGFVQFSAENLSQWLMQNEKQDKIIVLESVTEHDWHKSNYVQFREQIELSEALSFVATVTLRPLELNSQQISAQLEFRTTKVDESDDGVPQVVNNFLIKGDPNKAFAVFGFFVKPTSQLKPNQISPNNRLSSVLASPDYVSGASELALIFVLNKQQ